MGQVSGEEQMGGAGLTGGAEGWGRFDWRSREVGQV